MGEGNFSSVFPATHRQSGYHVAMKTMKKQQIKQMRVRHPNINNEIMMERNLLLHNRSNHVVKLFHTFQVRTPMIASLNLLTMALG